MKYRFTLLSAIVVSVALFGESAWAIPTLPILGDAQSFAVLGGSTVTNAGDLGTSITGNLGVWSSGGADAITGFDNPIPNTVYGTGAVSGGPGS